MSRGSDIARQSAVIAAVVFMLVAATVGIGLFGGTAVQDLQDGALAADATLLAPARQAFSIWSLVYVGLVIYAIWQALPSQRDNARQRRLGWLIALSAVLNGLWLVAAQFTTLPVTVLAIVALLVVLAITFRRAVALPPRRVVSGLLIDGVTGVHLGWVALATVANITAWLARIAPAAWGAAGTWVAVGVLVVVAVIGIAIGWASGGRLAPALAMAWGLAWVAVGRIADAPHDVTVGIAAIIAAVLILAAAVVRRPAVRASA